MSLVLWLFKPNVICGCFLSSKSCWNQFQFLLGVITFQYFSIYSPHDGILKLGYDEVLLCLWYWLLNQILILQRYNQEKTKRVRFLTLSGLDGCQEIFTQYMRLFAQILSESIRNKTFHEISHIFIIMILKEKRFVFSVFLLSIWIWIG